MRVIIAVILVCYSCICVAQKVDRNLINVNTVSPDAASLGKFGNIPVDGNTGVPGISIPIFDIEVGGLKVPVSLDYHAGGIRVDENSSSVGLGWAMNCGVTITRQMADYPDEDGSYGYLNVAAPATVNANRSTYWQYLYDVTEGTRDATQDVFSYSLNGQSVKFVFKKDGSVLQVPVTNNKIEKFFDGTGRLCFKITDTEGAVYYFESYEIYNFGYQSGLWNNIPSFPNVWHISKMIGSSLQDTIYFNYESACGIVYEKHRSYTWTLGTKPNGISMNTLNDYTINEQINYSIPQYLSSVTWRGGKVEFTNSCDRLDRVGTEKRVTAITVFGKSGQQYQQVKKVKLYQSYFYNFFAYTSTDERNYRLRLDSVGFVSTENASSEIRYKLAYDPTAIASRETTAQDIFGFYNGTSPSNGMMQTQLVKKGYNAAGIYDNNYMYVGDGNRSVDANYMKACIIKSIEYPTGGRTEFEFEPHEFPTGQFTRSAEFRQCSASGGINQTSSTTFTAGSDWENVRFNIFLSKYNVPGVTGYPVATLTDNTTSQVILQYPNMTASQDFQISLNALSLVAGHSYTMFVNIYTTTASTVSGSFEIRWEQPTTTPDNRIGGGMRVKSITNYTQTGSFAGKKLYKYGNNENGLGKILTPFNYYSINNKTIKYRGGLGSGPGDPCSYYIGYDTKLYYSGSLNPLSQFAGSPVLYDTITIYDVTDTDAKINGKTIRIYGIFQDIQTVPGPDVYNQGFQLQPQNWKNGYILCDSILKSNGSGGFVPVKVIRYNYTESRNASVDALKVIPVYTDFGCNLHASGTVTNDLNISVYPINTGLYFLTSSVTTDYDGLGNTLATTTNYTYGNTSHVFVTDKQSLNSKGETIAENFKYAYDFAVSGNAFQKMLDRNIVSPVVQSTESKNATQYLLAKVNYNDWFSNSKLLKPQTIEQKIKTNSQETRFRFNAFDIYGNILQQQKESDVSESYMWGYEAMYPVAKVTNATADRIAYTSFETSEYGGWSLNSGGVAMPNNEITGRKSYSGGVNKTVPTGDYIVTAWAYANISVNGQAGTTPVIISKRNGGWRMFEWKLTNVSSIQVWADNMDEVRLYPVGAQMTTYTYDPLIGMTTQCDVNNRITRYEYDDFNRLMLVRDDGFNILKKLCYNYHGQTENCTIYYNTLQQAYFFKQCTPGNASTLVTYSVPANTYASTVSVAAANARAQADIQANGQAYANTVAGCSPYTYSCTFTAASGFSLGTSSIGSANGVMAFYLAFTPTSTSMTAGTVYTVATISMGCRPIGVNPETFSVTYGGRTFEVKVYSTGVVTVKITAGSNLPASTSATVSGSYLDPT